MERDKTANILKMLAGTLGLMVIALVLTGVQYKKEIYAGLGNLVKYDVIVIGTDPEGIAAALSSSRNGMTTLLVDHRSKLGGLMTVGGLNTIDMNYSPGGELLTKGIFEEFFKQIEGDSFVIATAEKVFREMVEREPDLIVKLKTPVLEPVMEGNTIIGVKVLEKGKKKIYRGKRVIDATQDGDMAALAGVPFSIGKEDAGIEKTFQTVTLVFELGNSKWGNLIKALNEDGDPHTGGTVRSAWGYGEIMRAYPAKDEKIRFRGLNIGRQVDNRVLINAMHIFDVNPLDKESIKQGLERGRAELPHVVAYLRENIPGFENVYLHKSMDELYIRETRHIYGEYRLSINDLLENVDFWDKIGIGSYPVDIQATSVNYPGLIIGNPAAYSIPFRSLVPLGVENLLVVSRAASYDSLAHGSTRVIPVGMTAGEAAGVASGYSIKNNMTFREITKSREAINEIQIRLKNQGAFLEDFYYPHAAEGHWAIKGIRYVRSKGFGVGGYDNNYRFDEPLNHRQLESLLNIVLLRTLGKEHPAANTVKLPPQEVLAMEDVARAFLIYTKEVPNDEPFEQIVEKGYITTETAAKVTENQVLVRAAVYLMLAEFADYLQKTFK
jgi:hypothetical protein